MHNIDIPKNIKGGNRVFLGFFEYVTLQKRGIFQKKNKPFFDAQTFTEKKLLEAFFCIHFLKKHPHTTREDLNGFQIPPTLIW